MALACLLLVGCQSTSTRDQVVQPREFGVDHLAKADIDMVAEVNVRQSMGYLRELARKLYVRNPNQLLRGGHASRDAALTKLFDKRDVDVHDSGAAESINLAFDESFGGDRVGALMRGMRAMLLDGYGGKQSFYLLDRLDPQKLHYLARNFEIAFWKLGVDRDSNGRLFLLSNSLEGSGDLSFARLAGKLIGLQDHMAQVVADSTNRKIKNVIQGVASMVFFPI